MKDPVDTSSLTLRDSFDYGWSTRDLTAEEKDRLGDAGPDVALPEFSPQTEAVANALNLSPGDMIEWDGRVTQVVAFDDPDATTDESMQIKAISTDRDDTEPDSEPYAFAVWAVYKQWRKGNIKLDTSSSDTDQ